ncbi:MAG: putative sulfate exporter family transporter [Cyclobacteriaceae bacterium]|nr:putative sulfate exporter family transporter [Cyclobacteriaceae bacterium]
MQKPFSEDWASIVSAVACVLLALTGIIFWLPPTAWSTSSELKTALSSFTFISIGSMLIIPFTLALGALWLTGKPPHPQAFYSYLFLILITLVAHILSGYTPAKDLGLEVVIFSLLIGLAVSNLFRLPDWVKLMVQTELYIKTGLVLLGCGILFGDIMKAGALGMLQSLIVVIAVWQFCFWLGKKFGLDDEYRTMLSSAVAICGVSAAIATAGVIKGDNKKLSYVISLVLITAIPMLLLMPWLAKAMELPASVAGAWMGGTIDTTGAVVAAGNLLGEDGLKYATVVKFSQNVLLGIAAFAISLYWTYTKKQATDKTTGGMIWDRFPKFVLGFIAASLLFSFVLPAGLVSELKTPLKNIQTFWFALAFTCIGLETRFADIFNKDSKKPAVVFLLAQLFNILLTLGVAWVVFG